MRRKIFGIGETSLQHPASITGFADCSRFCNGTKRGPVECLSWLSDTEETVRFLKALFSWRCDQRRGKNGRRTPGVKTKSSLDLFWKWWHLIYKAEVGHKLSKDIQVKIRDVRSRLSIDIAMDDTRLTFYRYSR